MENEQNRDRRRYINSKVRLLLLSAAAMMQAAWVRFINIREIDLYVRLLHPSILRFMNHLKIYLEKILLSYPSINQNRIMQFRVEIRALMDKIYDEVEIMRENQDDIIMDFGVDVADRNLPNEE